MDGGWWMMDDDRDGDGWCGTYVAEGAFCWQSVVVAIITGQHFAILKKVKILSHSGFGFPNY